MSIIVHYFVFHKEFSHDILCTPRSDDNRRVAGAVHISAFIIHYVQTKHIGVCRPGGEAFLFIQCILWTKFRTTIVHFLVSEKIFYKV